MFDYNIPSGDNGDGQSQLSDDYNYSIVVECNNEQHQQELIGELEQKGVKCRPLIS